MTKKRLLQDTEELTFKKGESDLKGLLLTLKRQKDSDVWRRCYTKEIKVLPLYDNPIGLPILREKISIPCDDDVLTESMAGGGLLLEFPLESKTIVPLRKIAFSSLCERGHISGTVLQRMNVDDFCNVINTCLQQYNDSCLVLYRDQKISAVHSGDESDYSILSPYLLLSGLLAGLKKSFKDRSSFESGFITHKLVVAKFMIKDERVMDVYKPFLQKLGYEDLNSFFPLIQFSTSDVAQCGANLYPYITNGPVLIQIGPALSLHHKRKASIKDFCDNVGKLYSLFLSSVAQIEKMADIPVKHPVSCFANICKKISVSNRYASDALILFENTVGKESNALEVYIGLWEIITNMRSNYESEAKIFSMQERIARVLAMDVKAYDKREELS